MASKKTGSRSFEKPYQEAEPTYLDQRTIYDLGAQAAKELGYKASGNLEKLIREIGGHIEIGDQFGSSVSGYMSVESPDNFKIVLSAITTQSRDRFTLAHELAHFVLHSNFGEKRVRVSRSSSDRLEWEANWFAAGFLMPEKSFRKSFASGMGDSQLAEHFGVSVQAVEIRRKYLGLGAK